MFDRFLVLGLSLLPLLIAFCLCKITFFIAAKVLRRNECASQILKALKKPALLIFLVLAAFLSVQIALLPQTYEEVIDHALVVLLIAGLGWALATIVRSLYFFIRQKHRTEALEEFSRRSFLTQSQILYRAIMFVIIVLTFAVILMTFPQIKNFGIGILGSAGVAGLAIGLAARPILSNLISGFQIAFTRMLKMGDAVMVDAEFGHIEQIFLTHVILKTWDSRRMVIPISHFIEKPFYNYSSYTTELTAVTFAFCDFRAPLNAIRQKFNEIVLSTPLWNHVTSKVDVIDLTEQAMKLRFTMSAANPAAAFDLQCYVREKIVEYLQQEHPITLPRLRYCVREET